MTLTCGYIQLNLLTATCNCAIYASCVGNQSTKLYIFRYAFCQDCLEYFIGVRHLRNLYRMNERTNFNYLEASCDHLLQQLYLVLYGKYKRSLYVLTALAQYGIAVLIYHITIDESAALVTHGNAVCIESNRLLILQTVSHANFADSNIFYKI